jgi:hypothetical protein
MEEKLVEVSLVQGFFFVTISVLIFLAREDKVQQILERDETRLSQLKLRRIKVGGKETKVSETAFFQLLHIAQPIDPFRK